MSILGTSCYTSVDSTLRVSIQERGICENSTVSILWFLLFQPTTQGRIISENSTVSILVLSTGTFLLHFYGFYSSDLAFKSTYFERTLLCLYFLILLRILLFECLLKSASFVRILQCLLSVTFWILLFRL